jgi:uncharacterized protein (TIGR02444 family)
MQSSGNAAQETPLWRFSLFFYAQPDVASTCLELQDESGADINMLLFLLWLATLGRRLSKQEISDIESRVAPWRNAVVMPLRSVRRMLKATSALVDREQAEEVRNKVKSLELEAERLQQRAMYQLAQTFLSRQEKCEVQKAAHVNVHAYEQLIGTAFPHRATETLFATLALIARNREE